ncbi:segregation/condensation protein A [Halalkalibacter nanhaiisediminis]|uniref:Segregation and condensation protein A n=1 Tax=Halalkalibacter nanhaiisediminis TaxID=688079 RepID=A0A562QD31_9BACI|nr:segregation/condensation protein A [Halalkalibacter nanhaiisediminis]TWI54658.1 condensin subunit ScpA [Halalkalibacter nanhaiisediminis]
MNPYSVKLDTFEGPLDLLLHLINQAEVDIYDIPVAVITDQYMSYVHAMQDLQLDVASEYLVMAATLLAIKSKMLLPAQQEELFDEDWQVEEDEDPREELMYRLIEYKKYKEAATELKEKEQERSLVHTRPPEDLDPYISEDERRDIAIQGVSLFDMLSAYQKLLKRKELKAPRMTTVTSQEYSIEDRMQEVLTDLARFRGRCRFNELFTVQERGHIVVTFLAILELMKTRAIQCEQSSNFQDIMIYSTEGGV